MFCSYFWYFYNENIFGEPNTVITGERVGFFKLKKESKPADLVISSSPKDWNLKLSNQKWFLAYFIVNLDYLGFSKWATRSFAKWLY